MSSPTYTNAPPRERLCTPANIVTLIRICLVPVFVVAIISPWPAYFPDWSDAEIWKPWIAAGVFVLLAATDGLDGYLARSRGEVTNFGKFIDPLADKILVAAALLALIELGVLPSWVALIILTREFIVSGIRMVAASQGVVIAASWYGKAKTVSQIIAIVLFIIKDSVIFPDSSGMLHNPFYLISWAAMLVALILTIVSMLDYFVKARELLGFMSLRKEHEDAPSTDETAQDESSLDGQGMPALAAEDLASIEPAALDALAGGILDEARERDTSLATAESLTGGLIAATLTGIPGSSDVVRGGIVSYVNDVKQELLGVGREILALHGAVSEETACAMAQGARRDLGADVAVSATGIAGPDGAEADKPVGTVWIGFSDGVITMARCYHFAGNRAQVRLQTVRAALELVSEGLNAAESAHS